MQRVVLVGFMCAGKSAVGALLARALGWQAVDLDARVEAAAGMPVREIFAAHGEAEFRRLEREATAEVAGRAAVVVSTGGGWAADERNWARLGPGSFCVWLRISAEEAVRRAAGTPGQRPLLAGPEPLARARELLARREPLYARAHARVEAAAGPAEEVAEVVERLVRARLAPAGR